jgi:hypothetical protein
MEVDIGVRLLGRWSFLDDNGEFGGLFWMDGWDEEIKKCEGSVPKGAQGKKQGSILKMATFKREKPCICTLHKHQKGDSIEVGQIAN